MSTLSAAILALAPRAYYQCNEGSGTSVGDSSGNGYTGTFDVSPRNPTWGGSIASGGSPASVLFTRANSTSVILPTVPGVAAAHGNADYSVCFLIKRAYTSPTNTTPVDGWYTWALNAAGIARETSGSLGYTQDFITGYSADVTWRNDAAPPQPDDGLAHFIVITGSGTSPFPQTLYIDNVVYGAVNASGISPGSQTWATSTVSRIGAARAISAGYRYFGGQLSDVAFFPSVLSSTQRTALWTATGLAPSVNARASQSALEVVSTFIIDGRTSQAAAEAVITTLANARSSQAALEVVADTTPPAKARTSQESVEAVATEPDATARTSQVALETLSVRIPDPNARVSQNAGEVAVTLGPARALTSQVALELLTTNPLYTYTSQEALEVAATPFDANALTSQAAAEVIAVNPKYPVQDESWFWDIALGP